MQQDEIIQEIQTREANQDSSNATKSIRSMSSVETVCAV